MYLIQFFSVVSDRSCSVILYCFLHVLHTWVSVGCVTFLVWFNTTPVHHGIHHVEHRPIVFTFLFSLSLFLKCSNFAVFHIIGNGSYIHKSSIRNVTRASLEAEFIGKSNSIFKYLLWTSLGLCFSDNFSLIRSNPILNNIIAVSAEKTLDHFDVMDCFCGNYNEFLHM